MFSVLHKDGDGQGMARGRGRDDVDLLGTSDQERDGGGLHTRRHNPKFLKRKNINLN